MKRVLTVQQTKQFNVAMEKFRSDDPDTRKIGLLKILDLARFVNSNELIHMVVNDNVAPSTKHHNDAHPEFTNYVKRLREEHDLLRFLVDEARQNRHKSDPDPTFYFGQPAFAGPVQCSLPPSNESPAVDNQNPAPASGWGSSQIPP